MPLYLCEVPLATHGMADARSILAAPERSCEPAGTAVVQAHRISMG
jgi:hypothetical protein